MRGLIVPDGLAAACHGTPDRMAWLDRLPHAIRELQDRWLLSLAAPFGGSDVTCAWVAPAVRRGGTGAVLKLGMPHLEGVHEIEGLRFWDGDAVVREDRGTLHGPTVGAFRSLDAGDPPR